MIFRSIAYKSLVFLEPDIENLSMQKKKKTHIHLIRFVRFIAFFTIVVISENAGNY